jgi:transposase
MAYDEKFKIKVVEYCQRGNIYDDAVDEFGVSKGVISGWVAEYQRTGRIQKKIQNREHLRVITPEKIDEFLLRTPHGDQVEMARVFGCTIQSVSIALKKFGYSKKNSASYTRKLIL